MATPWGYDIPLPNRPASIKIGWPLSTPAYAAKVPNIYTKVFMEMTFLMKI